jgi:hypothetical protein
MSNKTKQKQQWIQWQNYLDNYKEYHKKFIEPIMRGKPMGSIKAQALPLVA